MGVLSAGTGGSPRGAANGGLDPVREAGRVKSPQSKKAKLEERGRQEASGGREGGPQRGGFKLFIGGIPYHWGDDNLGGHFLRFGNITRAQVVLEPGGERVGQSRGFGFVTFDRQDDATRAMNEMHGSQIEGRQISVRIAVERRGGPGLGRGGGAPPRGYVGASHSGSSGVPLPPQSTQVCIYVFIYICIYI